MLLRQQYCSVLLHLIEGRPQQQSPRLKAGVAIRLQQLFSKQYRTILLTIRNSVAPATLFKYFMVSVFGWPDPNTRESCES